jgi:CubicO group peptidase (beta-lactamase class C family)
MRAGHRGERDGIVRRFHAQHARGAFVGGQLVVRRRGETLVDEAAGLASGHRAGEPRVGVTPATRFGVFSVSKPFVAAAVALLEERGALRVESPLASFVPGWPADRTVLDVLTHRAGILLPELVADERSWRDRDRIRRAIGETPPRYPRGTLAYAPYEYGWILGEVVERAAGTPLPQLLAEALLRPASVEVSFTTGDEDVARSYWLGGRHVVAGVELSARWEVVHNDPATRATLVPGAGLVATAGALARFYELLLDGGRGLLRPETIRAYTTLHVAGLDRSNRLPLRVARGFLLGQPVPSPYGWLGTSRCYGHAGAFSAVAWADPDTGAAVAYVTNTNRGPVDLLRRSAPLGSAIRRALRA